MKVYRDVSEISIQLQRMSFSGKDLFHIQSIC